MKGTRVGSVVERGMYSLCGRCISLNALNDIANSTGEHTLDNNTHVATLHLQDVSARLCMLQGTQMLAPRRCSLSGSTFGTTTMSLLVENMTLGCCRYLFQNTDPMLRQGPHLTGDRVGQSTRWPVAMALRVDSKLSAGRWPSPT